ncbi:MAG: hypothetical protein ACYC0O_13080 [Desulfurivibrionaceae bacterium]
MSETDKDEIIAQDVDPELVESQRLLADIEQLRTQAEEQFKAAELSRKNADSEGLFAINAKKVCEEHATAISQLKGNVESEVNAIRSNKQQADEFLATLTAGKATIDADAKMISERRKEADLAASSIEKAKESCVAHEQELEHSKATAEAALKAINELREAANKAQQSAETSQKKAEAYSVDAQKQVDQIAEKHVASNGHSLEIHDALEEVLTSKKEIETVFEHLKKSDEIAKGHEARVAELTGELEALLIRVDKLLPLAASASLASSFKAQKDRFAKPQERWLRTFIWCIGGLVIVALPSFLVALGFPVWGHSEQATLTEIWRGLMLRMPIVIPLVWLAIYAGRNYMLSLRLEEEYAYKEAVSTAFEGYKREMTDIDAGDAMNPSPLTKLCTNILAAIAERPGRIYEGKHSDITILNESHGAAQEVAELAKKKIAKG